MLLFFIPTGIFVSNKLHLKNLNFSIIIFLGMFLQTFLLSICSFFINIGIEVFIVNLIFISTLTFFQINEIKINVLELFSNFKFFSVYSKFILLIVLLASLYKCSQSPFLIDNESYYIQTVKWINEFGLVKGLANLHIFLAQTSPFHVLQAGFNFSFLIDNFNDINGFILLISSLFYIQKFNKKHVETNKFHWIGLLPIFNVLVFQFISQPSPDLILILVSQIIFYLFLEENDNKDALKISIVLFLFLFFIKITIVPIALLILFWIYIHKKFSGLFIVLGILITLILVCKNTIISGYPLYPFEFFAMNFDWKIPNNLFLFITESTKNAGYFENEVMLNATFYQKIKSWLHLSGLNRFFNLGMILLFVLAIFTIDFQKSKKFKILYFSLLIHFLILILTSPQFRFFLPEFVFFAVFIINKFTNCLKIKLNFFEILMILFLIFGMIFIEFLDYKLITDNKLMQKQSSFTLINCFIPKSNSKYNYLEFEKVKNGNLDYYSPKENFFFFGTANGKLPCVNKFQIDYFEKYYLIKPQLRTNNLKDGFYSKITIKQNE